MPVTPLHLGPGVVFKAIAGKHMSLTVFGLSQVVMDVEVVGRLVINSEDFTVSPTRLRAQQWC